MSWIVFFQAAGLACCAQGRLWLRYARMEERREGARERKREREAARERDRGVWGNEGWEGWES
jgi:hypothetical protein